MRIITDEEIEELDRALLCIKEDAEMRKEFAWSDRLVGFFSGRISVHQMTVAKMVNRYGTKNIKNVCQRLKNNNWD